MSYHEYRSRKEDIIKNVLSLFNNIGQNMDASYCRSTLPYRYLKQEFLRQSGQFQQQLTDLLNYLLSPAKAIDDFECIDWCRHIVAGGLPFDEFSKEGRTRSSILPNLIILSKSSQVRKRLLTL